MFPILLKFPESIPLLGGHALHTYGALVAAGFLAGLFWVKHESKRVGLPVDKLMDLFFYVVLAAIIGSRLFYVFISVPGWWRHPLVFFKFWEGGLVFYGGLIGAVLVSIWYTRKHYLSFLSVADIFSPGIALGHVFGRLGCFAAGCCYGREAQADSPLAVLFPQTPYSIAPSDHSVYPTQLFEAAGELAIFFILLLFRKHKKFEGAVFFLYITLYPLLRIFLEFFRGDKVRGYLFGGMLSTAQLISLLWLGIALILWTRISWRKKV